MRRIALLLGISVSFFACTSTPKPDLQPSETQDASNAPAFVEWQSKLPATGFDSMQRAGIVAVGPRHVVFTAGTNHGVFPGQRIEAQVHGWASHILIVVSAQADRAVGLVVFIASPPRFVTLRDMHNVARTPSEVRPRSEPAAEAAPPLPSSPLEPWEQWDNADTNAVVGTVMVAKSYRQRHYLLFSLRGSFVPEVGAKLAVPEATGDRTAIVEVVKLYHVNDDPTLPIEEVGAMLIAEPKYEPRKGMTIVLPLE